MSCRNAPLAVLLVFLFGAPFAEAAGLTFACDENNDVYRVVVGAGGNPARFAEPDEAIAAAADGSAVLLLADGYPSATVRVEPKSWERAREKRLRLYVEYSQSVPGVESGPAKSAVWERAVVASDALPKPLTRHRLLTAHGCAFLPVTGQVEAPLLVLARVAGYDSAVFGVPPQSFPLLFRTTDGHLVATTKLSGFLSGRYAPTAEWAALWGYILGSLQPDAAPPKPDFEPRVRPAYGKDDPLPPDAERKALANYASWLRRAGLLVPEARRDVVNKLLAGGAETTDPPSTDEPPGDGTFGILEGYASHVRADGSQPRRLPLRADCHGEAAMVLALDASLNGDRSNATAAANLLDFVYTRSGMHRGVFGDPRHPAFGLVAWGDVAPAWTVATYGDDNARALLGTLAAGASLKSDRWDAAVLKGLLANLRTTGRLGFRGDRIDVPALERNGWRHYHDADTFNPALNFEAYPWAAFLWAYRQTGEAEFLDRARTAITRTMELYPRGWRWGDNMERARILLPLAWLVRVDDTPQHRQWLRTIATDLIKNQVACGAIPEQLGGSGKGGGHYVVPGSNEAYGTTETPLLQQNGDPVSDQLYTTGFALIGLHEAAAATGDPELKRAEDRLAEYLVRIQVRSPTLPYLDGAWFRAFDYEKWECWASSADMGWGAWSVEAGWAPAWAAATLGLRARGASLWDLTSHSRIGEQLPNVRRDMAVNEGGPWAGR
jgi:hypothetical protein